MFGSCIHLGINIHHKTPRQAAKIPHFQHKDSLLGANNKWRSCFDVIHYEIQLDLDPKRKIISGFVTTRFNLIKSSSQIQLDLDPKLIIDSIVGQVKLNYKREKTAVRITLSSQNKNQSISVYYHGSPKIARRPPWSGGMVWKQDKMGHAFAGVTCEGDGAQLWLPIKAWIGDEPDSADLFFTVPRGLTAVSNGVLKDKVENEGTRTFHWKTKYPINPYNISFYLGDYQLIEDSMKLKDGTNLPMAYYVLPENFEKAKNHFAQSKLIIASYEDFFGPYPWKKECYKLIESPYEGMEHQTAIAYGHGYKNERGEDFDYIILHETAHEWWGNSVSVADFSDVWIHEGMATYAEALYVERTKGRVAYLNYLSYQYLTILNRKPVIGPSDVYYWNYRDGDVYTKGAAMLHALRTQIQNDTLFFGILKSYYEAHAKKITDTKEFIELVNEKTGKDWNYFFNQFLYRRESPYLKWNFYYNADLKVEQLIYKFENVNDEFKLAIKVKQGDQTFFIYPNSTTQFYTLPGQERQSVQMNLENIYLQQEFGKLKK